MSRSIEGELGRFLVVGILNTGVGYSAILFFSLVLGMSYWLANALAYAIGLGLSFVFNRTWTFQSARHDGQFARFIVIFALCYVMQLLALSALIIAAGMRESYAQLAAILLYTVTSFGLQRKFVFGSRIRQVSCRPPRKVGATSRIARSVSLEKEDNARAQHRQ